MSQLGAPDPPLAARCCSVESYDALVSQLPDSFFGDESYDALAASLPSCIFYGSPDDFEDGRDRRIVVTCELGTVIGRFISNAKLLPPLLSAVDAVVCVVAVFEPHGALSGAVLCRSARECFLLPYTGSSAASLREWLDELKKFLHCTAADGLEAARFSVNVLQTEWRLQALACCEDALGDLVDVQYLASSFLGISPATALEEACIIEHKHASFVRPAQLGHLDRHWLQGLLDCARCRSLRSLVARALRPSDAMCSASSFIDLRAFVAALAQRAARTGVLVDLNRLDILKRSASAHRPRTPLLTTIKSSCEIVELACRTHAGSRFSWDVRYNDLSGAICSDVQHFPEFSTNLCSRIAVSLSSLLATVDAPQPPFAAFTVAANMKQHVTVLSILENGQRAVIRTADGTELETLSSSVEVAQLVRGEFLSVRCAMVSDYGFCFVSVTAPMCQWMFLGQAARSSVISAFAAHRSSRIEVAKFDRSQAAVCASSAVNSLLAAALPLLAAHRRCTCMRLALSSHRHDPSAWASQLEVDLHEAAALQFATLSALSEMLTGPASSQQLPYHAVKPSLLGRRAPSADTFFDAVLQHAWMSAADLMMLLTRESESGLREGLIATLNAGASAAACDADTRAAAERSPAKSAVHDCYSLVAVLSHTVVFSCRRHLLHTALHALADSAGRLGRAIDTDFPYRVAASDNIGSAFEMRCVYLRAFHAAAGDLYSWNCPLLNMLPELTQPQAARKRQANPSDCASAKPKRGSSCKISR